MSRKPLFLFIALLLTVAAAFSGCTSGPSSGSATSAPATTEVSTPAATEESTPAATEESTAAATATASAQQSGSPLPANPMPIVTEPLTLTYWVSPLGSAETTLGMKTMGEKACYQKMKEITGIDMQFLHCPPGSGSEQFQLMLASKDLPDIIGSWTKTYPGGYDKAVADGVYLKLNDYVEKYAQYYQTLRLSNEDIRKQTITDEGNIVGFYQVQADPMSPWLGMMLRKDFLDKYGLQMPNTIEDWYHMLTVFKENGIKYPMDWRPSDAWGGFFVNAYGIGIDLTGFYQVDGVVKYGYVQPGFKDFLTEFAKWYKEGLIDPDFASRSWESRDSMIINGDCGAFINYDWDVFNDAIVETGKGQIKSAQYPTLANGGPIHFRQKDHPVYGPMAVITTSCEHPAEAVRWFDYGYSEEGFMLYNYGIEGESYTLEPGAPGKETFMDPGIMSFFLPRLFESGKHPVFSTKVTDDPTLNYYTASARYKAEMGPFLRSDRATEKEKDFFYEARYELWPQINTDWNLPNVNFTLAEGEKKSPIETDINTYRDEMVTGFIMGTEPLSKWDEYVSKINSLGLPDLTAIYQAACDRYKSK